MPSVSRRYPTGRSPYAWPSGAVDDELRAPVVLMVSGGADSTALLVMAATSALDIDDGRGTARIARERLHVLHINHGLRGLDADEDEEFVRGLAAEFGIPCTVERLDVAALAAKTSDNVENAGREARYAAAAKLANELSEQCGTPRAAARICTAHTADDRAETFFMNAIRGSGAPGLSSIPRRRNRIIRPLLDKTHDELCEYLRMRGIVWREDDTNRDTRYLRAYVRHELMPVVERRNPRVVASIASTCDILSDEDAYLGALASRLLHDLIRRQDGGMIALDASRLAASEVALARRAVRSALLMVEADARLEARHINRVLGLVSAGAGSATLPMGVDVRVEYGLLFLRARSADRSRVAAWLEVPGTLELGEGGTLSARLIEVAHGADASLIAKDRALEWGQRSVLLDAEVCGVDPTTGGRLWVDTPHPGDIVCPLGMHGQSKKLADLLNETQLPAAERSRIPIVRADVRGPVVWVAGIRVDERAKCTPHTKYLLELTLSASE
jgi:tRNA(Ile)-lysidine synthase